MDLGGRKELFRALVGSHNYNLNTPESDKDYKIFIAPTFDDLYFNKQFSKSYIGETEDYDVHDIRKVSSLFWKANVNFLEVLFSEDIQLKYDVKNGTQTHKYLNDIFAMKNDIARMNLPYLYDACIGMHITKKKQIDKGTSGTQHLVDKYGYDTKQAMHSIRILNFLRRFADNEFTDFKQAIWYMEDEGNKEYLLDMKKGNCAKEEYYFVSEYYLNMIEQDYKDKYKVQKADVETNNTLIDLVKKIVKMQL